MRQTLIVFLCIASTADLQADAGDLSTGHQPVQRETGKRATPVDATEAMVAKAGLQLARVLWNEASPYASYAEMECIWDVHTSRAATRDQHVLQAQIDLSTRVTGTEPRRGTGNDRWSPDLNYLGTEPPQWTGGPWETWGPRWMAVLGAATDLVRRTQAGEYEPRVLNGRSFGWGSARLDTNNYNRRQAYRRAHGWRPFGFLHRRRAPSVRWSWSLGDGARISNFFFGIHPRIRSWEAVDVAPGVEYTH